MVPAILGAVRLGSGPGFSGSAFWEERERRETFRREMERRHCLGFERESRQGAEGTEGMKEHRRHLRHRRHEGTEGMKAHRRHEGILVEGNAGMKAWRAP